MSDQGVHALGVELMEREDSRQAVQELEAAGCKKGELLALLLRVRQAFSTLTFSRTDLLDAVRTINRTAKALRHLSTWGEARNLGLPGDAANWLNDQAQTLDAVAGMIKTKAATADKRKPARFGRAKARLVKYAFRGGEYHDEAVAALIEAVAGIDYSAEAHRKWRNRHFQRLLLKLGP